MQAYQFVDVVRYLMRVFRGGSDVTGVLKVTDRTASDSIDHLLSAVVDFDVQTALCITRYITHT